jgi:hypothetical protein
VEVGGHILVRPRDYPACPDGLSEQIEIAFDLIRIVFGVGDQGFGELSALAQIAADLDSLAARFRMSPPQYPAAHAGVTFEHIDIE